MQLKSTTGEAATTPEAGIGRIHAELPVGRPELGKLARWIPTKEWRCCSRSSTAPEAIPI